MKNRLSKVSRLLLYDIKSSFGEKLLLVIEMIFCMLMISIALSGSIGVSGVEREYKKLANYDTVTYLPENPNDEKSMSQLIYSQYELGNVYQITTGDMESFVESAGYDSRVVRHYQPKLSKGKWFADNKGQYNEVVLAYEYRDRYDVGDIVECRDIRVAHNEYSYYSSQLEIVGFMAAGSYALGTFGDVMSLNAIIYEDDREISHISNFILFEDVTREEMADNLHIGTDNLQFISMQEKYDIYMMSDGQIISFFRMFAVIGVFVLITSLLSAVIVNRSVSLSKNMAVIKSGTTQGELLTVRLISIIAVIMLALAVSLLLSIPLDGWVSAELHNMALTPADIAAGAGIVLGIYALFEIIDVAMLYRRLKKEKK